MPFSFPHDHRLVIVTEKCALSWSSKGITTTFTSGSSGIHAAKEATDGSGTLAVADSQVVLLHDLDRGMDRSYRLKATDGQIRLLQYSNDATTLYFTTTLQNAVQRFSLNQSQLLDPVCLHPSPPTVIAIGSNNHLMVSASESPSIVYLQNLGMGTQPQIIQPRATSVAVVAAVFHPERPNIFMLGFRDGTVAAYDATRILREKKTSNIGSAMGRSEIRSSQLGPEIGTLPALHTVTTRQAVDTDGAAIPVARAATITGMGFIPGYKTRAVTVGTDGKCRIIDFEQGGKILRTWHVRGPATCLSILSPKPTVKAPTRSRHASKKESNADANEIIAVGRLDGKVLLFDFLGLQLGEQVIDSDGGRIIDVDWKQGAGPKPALGDRKSMHFSVTIQTPLIDGPRSGESPLRRATKAHFSGASEPSQQVLVRSDGIIPPTIFPPDGKVKVKETITVEEFGTVNHSPDEKGAHRDLPPIQKTNYMDLFSPIKPKPSASSPKKPSPQKRSSPQRPRPRLASDTFMRNVDPCGPQSPALLLSSSRRHKASTSIDSIYPRSITSVETNQGMNLDRESPSHPPVNVALSARKTKTASPRKHRRASNTHMPGAYPVSQATLLSKTSLISRTSGSSVSSSGSILANLRRVEGQTRNGSRRRSGLGLLAPYMSARSEKRARPTGGRKSLGRGDRQIRLEIDQESPALPTADISDPVNNGNDADIWLSDASSAPSPHHKHRTPATHRRSTKKSAVISTGAAQRSRFDRPISSPLRDSDVSFSPARIPDLSSSATTPLKHRSRSAEKENLEPGSAQSPKGPVRVQDYFPRKSSLPSAADVLSSSPQRRGVQSHRGKALREADANADGSAVRRRAGQWHGRGAMGGDGAADKNESESRIWDEEKEMAKSTRKVKIGCLCGGVCCGELRREVESMRNEMDVLRREMRALRGF